VAESVGLPPGVLNVLTADREVSELLVRDPRVDKIIGNPFESTAQMGPLAASRQRDRVLGYIARGVADGATLATGGGRPKDLERGWYVEPTVFGNVSNSSAIAQEEIFGPVISVIPAEDEADAVKIANDTIYGLNASVFTNDVDRARAVAGQLRSGTVGHNGFHTDFGVSFGGFKQSGIGRVGGTEGLHPFLETKFVVLNGRPAGYEDTAL
jgi:acyl-CoA reductase-like NAD-dependent aldehyde dehydrogenase